MKVIAVDFDGTLCENKYPEIGKPIYPVINKLFDEIEDGSKVILWTCREGNLLQEAVEWCRILGLEFNAVNTNLPERVKIFGECRKVGADEYWDDRSINPINNREFLNE